MVASFFLGLRTACPAAERVMRNTLPYVQAQSTLVA